MSSISKKLRQLNLRGLDKVTAVATAQYIEQLEKELDTFKKAEAEGKLIKLKFAVGQQCWFQQLYCCGFFSDNEPVELKEDMCESCPNKGRSDVCAKHLVSAPKLQFVHSEVLAIQLSKQEDVFATKKDCQKYCDSLNRQRAKAARKSQGEVVMESTYKSRAELEEDKVEKLRQADRDYYEEHKEEVNQKDRDKYHRLHPNARYYKPRAKKQKLDEHGQIPGQMSLEDFGITVPDLPQQDD
ncbi:MAG: hypothetical protein NC218_01700 [Acetobacter sp.]|nr:hypothetical protein [Acetobacter sp.]